MPPRKDGTASWLDGNYLEARFALFEHFGNASNCATCTHTSYEEVNLSFGILPNFLGGCFPMNFRVGWVVKLLQHVGIWCRRDNFLRPMNTATHSLKSWRQFQLGSISSQHCTTLCTHGVGHRQNELVALSGSSHCQSNARVSRRRFH